MKLKKKPRGIPFKKGKSGNPTGRPKSSLLSALAKWGEKGKGDKKNTERLARVAWEKAISGDLEWAQWLADRILGKAQESMDVTSEGKSITVNLTRYE